MMGNSKKRITKTNKAGAEHGQFRLLSHVCLEQCERRKGTELKRSIRVLQLKHQHMRVPKKVILQASACFRAGASLTPSPVIATMSPSPAWPKHW